MGADMTVRCAPACDLTPERIERLQQVVRAIPNDDPDLRELMLDLGYDYPDDAKESIIERCQESQDDSREIAMLHVPGCPFRIQVTGGMSWGDAPTEACRVLEHIQWCRQAWEVMEKFAREDFAAASEPKPE